jgi:hypothetical protein
MDQPNQDDVLLTKLNEAVKAANEAETSVTTAQAELVSRSKAVGLLLLEARKLHPLVKDFDAYLNRVDGLKLSRAYDYMRLAGGRATDEQLRKEARERKRKSRAKPKKIPPGPAPEPKQPEPKVSVTVTESAEVKAAYLSAPALQEFEYACRTYLPRLNEADLKKAHTCFMEGWQKSQKKEAA